MKIHKSRKIHEQVVLANGLKAELLRLIRRKIAVAKSKGRDTSAWNDLLQEIAFTAEAFKVTLKKCPAQDVDRRASMLTGPFFTSAEFPIPVAPSGALFPVVQLELDELSAAIQDNLGDGLLQLWYDLRDQKALVRVIPLAHVYSQALTDFNWSSVVSGDGFPLPRYWNLNPVGEEIEVITRLISMGVQSNENAIEAHYCHATDDETDWLWTLLKLFCKHTPNKFGTAVEMFGTHNTRQYSITDVGMKRLINIGDWGSTGHAQIFYKISQKEPTQFSFWSCVR